jgi:membrane associated rhomboid family serine protease
MREYLILLLCPLVQGVQGPPKLTFASVDGVTCLLEKQGEVIASQCDIQSGESSVQGNRQLINDLQESVNSALSALSAENTALHGLISDMQQQIDALQDSHSSHVAQISLLENQYVAADASLTAAIESISLIPGQKGEQGEQGEQGGQGEQGEAGQPGQPGQPGAAPPHEEHFMELIFPGFDPNSFIWRISVLQLLNFWLSIWLGNTQGMPSTCSLYTLGASWGPAITTGQVWRFITPIFLHANTMHLFFNLFFQLRIGFGMEKQFGQPKFIAIYFLCGVLGNLLSVCVDPYKLAVGASTSGFGLIGVWLAELLLTWHRLGPARSRALVWITFMVTSVVTMSVIAPTLDIYGHLGGALAGFLLGCWIADAPEEQQPEYYFQVKRAAATVLALYFGLGFSKILLFSPNFPLPNCNNILHMQ